MKEFEFDDIDLLEKKQELNDVEIVDASDIFGENINEEVKKEVIVDDTPYKEFEIDIEDKPLSEVKNTDSFEKPSFSSEQSFDDPFEKSLFSSNNDQIDNPFVQKQVDDTPVISEEEKVENMYKSANENIKPIISYTEEEIDSKEDALEEALSHTTRFTPFTQAKPEIAEIETEEKKSDNKSSIAFLIILFAILLVAILVIPKIASLI